MTHDENELYFTIALSMIVGVGSIKAQQLIKSMGSASAIFNSNKSDLMAIEGISPKITDQILERNVLKLAENELLFCQKNQIQILPYTHPLYPKRSLIIDDKPILLYVKGNIHQNSLRNLGIVGTRKSSEYGGRFLELMIEKLKSVRNVCTISGMAQGIDQKAHTASLAAQIPTVAVMGLALDKVFPSQNKKIAEKVLENGGGWISETNSQEKINQGVFPRRNRIIAALSDALLVVETNIKGGSMITARLANDYNKDVFALPGRYQDSFSKGCNFLIRENLARLINSPDDLLLDMNWIDDSHSKTPSIIEIPFEGSETQKKMLHLIRTIPDITIERLSMELQMLPAAFSPDLISLEMEGLIRSKPGNKYEVV